MRCNAVLFALQMWYIVQFERAILCTHPSLVALHAQLIIMATAVHRLGAVTHMNDTEKAAVAYLREVAGEDAGLCDFITNGGETCVESLAESLLHVFDVFNDAEPAEEDTALHIMTSLLRKQLRSNPAFLESVCEYLDGAYGLVELPDYLISVLRE